VNPVIVEMSEETIVEEESCLSFPEIYGQVARSAWVDVQYQDLRGIHFKERYVDELAQIFQHEFDHIDKVLLVDRIGTESKAFYSKRLEKMVKRHGPGGVL
jgi:peptide deformylase